MAEVYVPQPMIITMRDNSRVTFQPGINTVPSGLETHPFIAYLITATADKVAQITAEEAALGDLMAATQAATDAQMTAVATQQVADLATLATASATWATNRQAAIDAGQPYVVRHPNPVVAQSIALTAYPSIHAGSGFIQPPPPPPGP